MMASMYLNAATLQELIRKITTGIDPQCRDDLETLNDAFSSFHAYADAVIRGEIRLQTDGHGTDGQDYRNMVFQYDQTRHSCHEAAIVNVRVLNRMAALYELDPVFTGDDAHRHQVADFCLEMDQYFFRNRRMKLS